MSTDLLRDLPLQTKIADSEGDKPIYGWAVLPLHALMDRGLSAVLTRDVPTNRFHVAVSYGGKSRHFSDEQFRLELTRCVLGWVDRAA